MKGITLVVILIITLNTFSQTALFSYDASGNRTNRWLEVKEIKQAEAGTAEFILPELRPTDEAELLNEVKVNSARFFPVPIIT